MRRALLALFLSVIVVGCGSQSKIGTVVTNKYTGILHEVITEGSEVPVISWQLSVGGTTYDLEKPTPRKKLQPGKTATVSGQLSGSTIKNARIQSIIVTRTAKKPTLPFEGTRTVNTIAFTWTETAAPWTKGQVEAAASTNAISVKKFYEAASFGKLKITSHVYGVYTVNKPPKCLTTAVREEVEVKAEADGYVKPTETGSNEFSANTQILLPDCGTSGQSIWPGFRSWVSNSTPTQPSYEGGPPYGDIVKTMSHELAHSFRGAHAGDIRCSSGATGIPYTVGEGGCVTDVYGNSFDTMGGTADANLGSNNFNARSKLLLGWWEPSQVKEVTDSGTYTVLPNETNTAGIHLLKIPRPNQTGTKGYYYVEFHQPSKPFSDYTEIVKKADRATYLYGGAWVQLSGFISAEEEKELANPAQTSLLYMNPAVVPYSFATEETRQEWDTKAVALPPGKTYEDTESHVAIKTESVSAAGVVVHINIPVIKPKITQALSVSASQVALTWTPVEGAESYEVLRNGVKVGSATASHYIDAGRATSTSYKYCVKVTGQACSGNVTVKTLGTSIKGNIVGWATQNNVGVGDVRMVAHSGGRQGVATTNASGFYNIRELLPAIEYGVAVLLPDGTAFSSPILAVIENRATEYSVELP